jgi:hypothetical protein
MRLWLEDVSQLHDENNTLLDQILQYLKVKAYVKYAAVGIKEQSYN